MITSISVLWCSNLWGFWRDKNFKFELFLLRLLIFYWRLCKSTNEFFSCCRPHNRRWVGNFYFRDNEMTLWNLISTDVWFGKDLLRRSYRHRKNLNPTMTRFGKRKISIIHMFHFLISTWFNKRGYIISCARKQDNVQIIKILTNFWKIKVKIELKCGTSFHTGIV